MFGAANLNTHNGQSYTEEDRLRTTRLVMKLFERWQIDNASQLNLLGMKSSSRAILSKYRNGSRAIPDDIDKLNRVGLLLFIHKCLRLQFPENPNLVYSWITRRNKNFDNKTPLEFIIQYGLIGLAKVVRYLEFELVR